MTEWHDTGFGGSTLDGGSWQRLGAALKIVRNGTQLSLWLRLPGDEKFTLLSVNRTELTDAIEGLREHGDETFIRVEVDAPIDVVMREVYA